jgi:hypothetical protein
MHPEVEQAVEELACPVVATAMFGLGGTAVVPTTQVVRRTCPLDMVVLVVVAVGVLLAALVVEMVVGVPLAGTALSTFKMVVLEGKPWQKMDIL